MILTKTDTGRGETETVVYLLSGEESAEVLASGLKEENMTVVSVEVPDWNRDLTPWPAAKVFGKGEDFTGGADAFLAELTEEILRFEERAGLRPARRILAGYSLGGLFAVYGALNSELFTDFASVSGSMWFDGFEAYAAAASLPDRLKTGYFSVGDREKNSKNERMKTVEDCTKRISKGLGGRGLRTVFELNPGTHFTDPEQRILKAVRWILKN